MHLGSVQADYPVYIPGAVEEVGDGDSVFARGDPVLLGAGVDLEDVGPRAEYGLLSAQTEGGKRERERGERKREGETIRKCLR